MRSREVEIVLNTYEARTAIATGTARHIESVRRGSRDGFGLQGSFLDGLCKHINGAGGEMAAAKALGIYCPGHVGVYHHEPDLPPDWEVRTRSRATYDLLVRPNDRDDRRYVHVVGELPHYQVVGWIDGIAAKDPAWMQTHGGRDAAYFVPAHELVRIGVAVSA